ncbi:CDP-glucose 4,6-dehydratase [Polynucleobacter tropicus]|uniref:CDP-glucose 4,6-dehydratase n=1 Tax=Polynucleobacter tropicus TaxID=1743174 RepID=A0A6M9PW16_9BURK|nr:CDP-glucose 4,6-dehydratase [Polynucleobacter tropicus]QKM64042.1 CDP-glucose 4,6-dehydratase [Polynucleobacter tropicus]
MDVSSKKFWHGKRVLLTGHSGFKGAWLALQLYRLGAKVVGIGLPPIDAPSLFNLVDVLGRTDSHFVDIRDADAISAIVKKAQPEIVFHMAAQALVRRSYRDPLDTFSTNVMGTASVLDALRGIDSVKVVVAVTTDKVYKNLERIQPYREIDELGGYDPYSASKAASELIISSYRDSYLAEKGIAIASARAGNVIGGGDWSEDRLIPDAIRAWDANIPLEVRRPDAVRPWQHVLEPINAYLVLAEKLYSNPSLAGAYNFGPQSQDVATVRSVVKLANKIYGHGSVLWGDAYDSHHEAGLLCLDVSKAKKLLGVTPYWSLTVSVERTMKWYQQFRDGKSAIELCEADIQEFFSSMSSQ